MSKPPPEPSQSEPVTTTAEQPRASNADILVEVEYSPVEIAQALASADQPVSVESKEPSPSSSSGISAFDDVEQPG